MSQYLLNRVYVCIVEYTLGSVLYIQTSQWSLTNTCPRRCFADSVSYLVYVEIAQALITRAIKQQNTDCFVIARAHYLYLKQRLAQKIDICKHACAYHNFY